MGDYSDTDAPPSEDAPTAPRAVRIRLTEAFVTSNDFGSLPGLLQSCRGDAPVELTVATRRWRIPNLTVNPARVGKLVSILDGVSVEE